MMTGSPFHLGIESDDVASADLLKSNRIHWNSIIMKSVPWDAFLTGNRREI